MREAIDLASERLRSYVLAASDESLGSRHQLIKYEDASANPDGYDGWLTRRRSDQGHDWAILRLGVPGIIEKLVIDSSHFVGNNPLEASVEACMCPHNTPPKELTGWTKILAQSDIAGDKKNEFVIESPHRFSHLRLNIYPDGGVARLRVLGHPVPNWMAPGSGPELMDLAASVNGGQVTSVSDSHFGDSQNLVNAGDCQDPKQAWVTQRRRGEGHDWALIRLVGPGRVHSITLDTAHLIANCPDRASIEASCSPDPNDDDWFELLPEQNLLPHTEHVFQDELADNSKVVWLRLNIFPDGGMARIRVWGELSPLAREQARLLFINSSQKDAVSALFKEVCHSDRWVEEICRSVPFANANELLKKGAGAWSKCEAKDWKQALDGHPRIGEKAKGGSLSAKWSRKEQSKAATPDEEMLKRLRSAQEQYFQKFKFIFLICATGKSTSEVLDAVETRLQNQETEELQIVAEEQAKIIHLRLEKLLKL